jgi:hypothetical protein
MSGVRSIGNLKVKRIESSEEDPMNENIPIETPCPIWQCGGTLHQIEWERPIPNDYPGWQVPLLKCDNCGGLYMFLRFDEENKYPLEEKK